VRALETGIKTSFFFLSCIAASSNEFYMFPQWTYIVFILVCPENKQTNQLLKQQQQNKSRNDRRSHRFFVCHLLPFHIITQHESGTRRTMPWSVTIYKTKSGIRRTMPWSVTIYKTKSGIRRTMPWSVTIYKTKSSSQCNLTAQREQVQDKYTYTYIYCFIGVF
jgi:hypothetical protein